MVSREEKLRDSLCAAYNTQVFLTEWFGNYHLRLVRADSVSHFHTLQAQMSSLALVWASGRASMLVSLLGFLPAFLLLSSDHL